MIDWNATVEDLGPRLQRYFLVQFPAFVAADLVQETLVRLVRKVDDGSFDEARGTLRMLAFGIAHFVRLEALSRRTEVTAHHPPIAGESLLEAYASREREATLRMAIRSLKEVERQIVCLHLDEEMTLQEIATILDMPLGTVKSHIHRAKASLRVILNEREDL